jgi:alpha-glucoside transport system substrate-binding protein
VFDYRAVEGVFDRLVELIEAGEPPDLAFVSLDGLHQLAEEGHLVSLEELEALDTLKTRFPDHLLDVASYDRDEYGIPSAISATRLVWYHLPTFDERGYQAPDTWDELMELSAQMIEDELTPWCVGLASGESSGWPATDWLEDAVLRTAGPDTYDDWVRHWIPFDHADIMAALESLSALFFTDGWVAQGPAAAVDIDWTEAALFMVEPDGPSCIMSRQGDFLREQLGEDVLGADIGVFALPEGGLMSAGYLIVFDDRPEVRAAIDVFTSADTQCALRHNYVKASANYDVDPDCYQDIVARASATLVQSAGPDARTDGSDSMPDEVEAAFLEAMLDYFRGSPAAEVLGNVEAAWQRVLSAPSE